MRNVLGNHPHLTNVAAEVHYLLEFKSKWGWEIQEPDRAVESLVNHKKFLHSLCSPTDVKSHFQHDQHVALADFFQRYFGLIQQRNDGTRLILKHPAMVQHLDIVRRIFPAVSIINMIRDPRAAISSHRMRWPRRNVWWCTTLWRNCVREASAWTAEHKGVSFYTIRYEDLIAKPEVTTRSLCSELKIPFCPEMLDGDFPTTVHSLGEGNVSRPSGFDASRNQIWREKLTSNEVRLISSRCHDEMLQHGYETEIPIETAWTYAAFVCRQWSECSLRNFASTIKAAVRSTTQSQ